MTEKIGNGTLTLPLRDGKFFTVWGGPFSGRPVDMHGVKMQPEGEAKYVPGPHDDLVTTIFVPTNDFSVPHEAVLERGVDEAVRLILDRERVYIGCMAGRGRTGLFMSALVKAFNIKNPVEYVRWDYFKHAVETKNQYEFIDEFQPAIGTVGRIEAAKRHSVVKYWMKNSLTK